MRASARSRRSSGRSALRAAVPHQRAAGRSCCMPFAPAFYLSPQQRQNLIVLQCAVALNTMSDNEIEFLGSNPAVPPALQRPATGIVLHVESYGSDDSYRLAFSRLNSSVIHVGRRPGIESESRTRDIDSGRVMFRCPVVSRKHAKIAFSDSGHVYLIDLSSHHGTHVRKAGEMFSKSLKAEVPTRLSDGDIITFGKEVGRHSDDSVQPVVVRIEMVRTIKPLVVPVTPSDQSGSTVSRPPSGRYGAYSSDELPSPCYDTDSDVEAPSTRRAGSFSSFPCKAFDVLKRLIPPSLPHSD
ncbi:hypothetical protein DFP72DRAFT_448763 [Ephemerocybe angulata]|uniref:FHA domain-containing protein n=1 Tax=Ephemerocybe angulata TaxID=980116 RepID=A0A8H6HU52_9AGAR|nr:hypothetical protein DFP72DRAFT_448763 [Tulosesus angulatus]